MNDTTIPVGWHRHKNGGGLVQDTAHVDDSAHIGPDAQVYGTARVGGTAWVYGTARVGGNAQVYGTARVGGNAQVYGTARVGGTAWVYGTARVGGTARVSASRHVLTFSPLGEVDVTLFRTDGGHVLQAGCTTTTIDEAREALRRRNLPNLWPDVAPEVRELWRKQWRAALTVCQYRVDEWDLEAEENR